jgi:uncharacterized membrane protein YhaH (DUF805 family)
MDFKKFYFSPEARVNRKQWWLWLVLPFTVISILLGFVDMARGTSFYLAYHQPASLQVVAWSGSQPVGRTWSITSGMIPDISTQN